jgi:ribonuclease Z
MAPRFHPRLVNGPFDDPALYIAFAHEKRAILFDLGNLSRLSPRDILKITHCFVSHTHMDHFCGFDHLLRLCLGREKRLHFYGPAGFLDNLEGKLRAYNWNLVNHFRYPLVLSGTEIADGQIRSRHYACRDGFKPQTGKDTTHPYRGILLKEPSLSVKAAILDHGIPCLGFCLEESINIQIDKAAMARMSLMPGPWIRQLKETLHQQHDKDTWVEVPTYHDDRRRFRLGELANRITRRSNGQKIGYITDAAGHRENQTKMIALVRNADHLFIESAFQSEDYRRAASKFHLTASQAGEVAAKAGVKRYTLFHFSPRYNDDSGPFYQEARSAHSRISTTPLPQFRGNKI